MANGACLVLKNCSKNRNDKLEDEHRGESINDLNQDEFPVCTGERGTFMAPFAYEKKIYHPYITRPLSVSVLRRQSSY